MSVQDSVRLAQEEIAEVFTAKSDLSVQEDYDTGFFGDVVGVCPVCGRELKRFRSFYGCTGYQEGCRFSVNITICKRVIPLSQLRKLITEGKTDVLSGFVSGRTGKTFDASLRLSQGKAVFEFPERASSVPNPSVQVADGEEPPLPEPPPGY